MDASCEVDPEHPSGAGSVPDRSTADLDRICAELNVGRETARSFVRDYLNLLPARLERIDRELDALLTTRRPATARSGVPGQLNTEPAVVALLSLDSSSVMLGAFEVSLATHRLRRDLQVGYLGGIEDGRRELSAAVDRTQQRLARIDCG